MTWFPNTHVMLRKYCSIFSLTFSMLSIILFWRHYKFPSIYFQTGEKVQFSENVASYDKNMSFSDMNISRPLMKVKIVVFSLHDKLHY